MKRRCVRYKDLGELGGKVAIVTGAGRLRGIGRATAVAMARLGANVVITGTGRDPETYPGDEKAAGRKDIERVAEQVELEGLDLSAVRVLLNGSEAVSPDTLARFTARFAPYGRDPGAAHIAQQRRRGRYADIAARPLT